MDNLGLNIDVSANTQNAEQNLKNVYALAQEANKSTTESAKSAENAAKTEQEENEKTTKSAQNLAEARAEGAKSAENAAKAAENLAKQEASTSAVLERTTGAANNANGALSTLSGVFGTAGAQASAAAQSMGREASSNNDVANTAKNATNSVNELNKATGKNSENTGKAASANKDFENTITAISPAIGGMIGKMTGAMAAIEAIKIAINALNSAAQATLDIIKEGIELQSSLEQTGLRVGHAYQDFEKTAETMELIPKLAKEWGASIKDVGKAAQEVARLEQNFGELASYIRDTSAATGKSLQETANIIGRAMQGSARGIKQMQEQLGITTKTLQLYGAAADEDGQILSKTTEEQEKLKEAVKDFIEANYGEAYLNYASTAAGASDNLSASIEQLKLAFGGPFSGAIETVKNELAGFVWAIVQNEEAINAFKDVILNALSTVLTSFSGVFQSIPGANLILKSGIEGALNKLNEIAKKADDETLARRKKQAEELQKHEAELRKKNPEIEIKSKAQKEEEKARETAQKEAEKAAEKAARDRQKVIDALEKEARKREDTENKIAEKARVAAEKQAERQRKEEQKRLDAEQKQHEKELQDQEKIAAKEAERQRKELENAQKVANIKLNGEDTENPEKPDKFAGYDISINKEGDWYWRKDQSEKFADYEAYKTETGEFAWRKRTIETADNTEVLSEKTAEFAQAIETNSNTVSNSADNLQMQFQKLADAMNPLISGFGELTRATEQISNVTYNMSNNIAIDNKLSAGIDESNIIKAASNIAEKRFSQSLSQSQIIGNSY